MQRQTLVMVAAVAAMLVARAARAQEAVISEIVTDDTFDANRVTTYEGNGYTLSKGLQLHSSIGLLGGYLDNVFYQASDENPIGAGVTRVVGNLFLATDQVKPGDLGDDGTEATPSSYDLRAGLQLGYDEYISDNNAVEQQHNLGVNALVDFVARPGAPLKFLVNDYYRRAVYSPNFEDNATLNRDDNQARIGVGYRSPSSALSSTLYYNNWVEVFENGAPANFANRLNQTVGIQSDWQWRPKTKFVWDVSYGFFGPTGDSMLAGMPFKTSSRPLRITAGVGTLLTDRTSLKAHVGYARATYEQGEGYSAPIGGAEFAYRWAPTGRFVILYDFDHYDSLNANFYQDTLFAAKAVQQVSNWIFDGGAELHLRTFGGIPMAIGKPDRDDTDGALYLRAQMLFADHYTVSAEYRFDTVQTGYRANVFDPAGNVTGIDNPSYVRNQFLVGVRAAY